MLSNPGLYVHLPWCVKKCPYCDFNSHTLGQQDRFLAYTDALIADLEHQCQLYQPEPLGSIFFGGGTPSLFAPKYIHRIVERAKEQIGFVEDIEITLEANPGTTEYFSFAELGEAGINRVSLGIQSFNQDHLTRLGRIHGEDEVYDAIEKIKQSGIEQLNLDLMYGLPEQTLEMALEDLETAVRAKPTHISHYNLTIEPNTLFAVQTPKLPSDEICFSMQLEAQKLLANTGFAQYEVSAYAQPNFRSRHNLNYWRFGDYLGIGAGAHGKISQGRDYLRTVKPRHPTQYLQDPIQISQSTIAHQDRVFEFMLNRLRLNEAIDVAEINTHLSLNYQDFLPKLTQAQRQKLMTNPSPDFWQVTALGQRFLNDLQQIFLP